MSYQGTVDFCASKKMRLCTFDEYCPNGRLNKPDEGNAFNSLKKFKLNFETGVGASGTHRTFENLGIAGYRENLRNWVPIGKI